MSVQISVGGHVLVSIFSDFYNLSIEYDFGDQMKYPAFNYDKKSIPWSAVVKAKSGVKVRYTVANLWNFEHTALIKHSTLGRAWQSGG